jgi:hypothetical protein
VFRSRDEGRSWEAISPDLTRNDTSKLGSSGGELTPDNTSAEYYCTVYTISESPVEAGVIWAGTDDGRVHVTRDAGKSWQDVTPTELPEWGMISSVAARRGRRLRVGDPPQARRLQALPLQDHRPRRYLVDDRGRHPGG